MQLPRECNGCPIAHKAVGFVPNQEPKPGDLMAWGEMPGADEVQQGEPFVGRSGQLLRGALKLAGRSPGWPGNPRAQKDVCYRNVVQCRQPGNEFPGKEAAKYCMNVHGTHKGMEKFRHAVCGANAVEALSNWRPMISKKRGSMLWLDVLGTWGTITIHPAFLVRGGGDGDKGQDHLYPLLVNDLAKAAKRSEPIIPSVNLTRNTGRVYEAWKKGGKTVFSLDIEGSQGNLSLLGVSWKVDEAWVMPWSHTCTDLTTRMLQDATLVAHNATYDLEEIELNGVPEPDQFLDTLTECALYDPGVPMGLESQCMTHVPGSHHWKGLIDHVRGPSYDGGTVGVVREQWRQLLKRLGRAVPRNHDEWFAFYNGLDAAWGYALHAHMATALENQGRWAYYRDVLKPLQSRLKTIGSRGMEVDQDRLTAHQTEHMRRISAAKKQMSMGNDATALKIRALSAQVLQLEDERDAERVATGDRKFSGAKELTKVRTQVNALRKKASGFDFESAKQKREFLYDYLGLPEVKKKGTKAATTDQPAIESLLTRLRSGKIRPRPGVREKYRVKTQMGLRYPEIEAMLSAISEASSASSRLHTYLKDRPSGVLKTTYSQHRNIAGRLSSGTDDSEFDKKTKRVNLQNWPKDLRDIVVGNFVQADWKALHWAIVMLESAKLSNDDFHMDMYLKHQAGEFDPHRYLAAIAFQCKEEDVLPWQRQAAKGFTFGRLYLGAARTLGRKNGIEDKISELVCAAHEPAFRVGKWQKATVDKAVARAVGKRGSFVESPLGWRRYFWSYTPKETDVLATEVLSMEADMLKTSMNLLPADPGSGEPGYLVTSTHDSIMLEAEQGQEETVNWLQLLMERPFDFMDGKTFGTEGKIGKNWKEVS